MIKVELAKKDDSKEITKHNLLMAEETENIKLSYEKTLKGVLAVIDNPEKGFYLVAKDDKNKIIGQLLITYEWSDWRNCNFYWLQSVYVKKEYRKKGVFKALFKAVKKIAQENNACGLRLYVANENENTKRVYEKLEMKKSHYEIYEYEFKS